MTAFAANAVRQHYRALEATAGREVRYRRHDTPREISTVLVPAQTDVESLELDEEQLTSQPQDFVRELEPLMHDVGRLPEPGDHIDYVEGDQAVATFRVSAVSNERHWRWTDQHRVAIRFHTFEAATHHE